MKFAKALRALLVLGLFQQAYAQNTVTVKIGEYGSNVFVEWEGSLGVLPPTPSILFPFTPRFYISGTENLVTAVTASIKCFIGGDFNFVGFKTLTTGFTDLVPDSATGDSAVYADPGNSRICVAENYVSQLGQTMTGCLVFNNKSFASMNIVDVVKSTTSWNSGGTGGLQSITFETKKSTTANICVFPPVAPPVTPPVEPPIAAPVAAPIEPPVAAPVAGPVAAPVSTPTAPIARAPVTPPTTGDSTSIIPIIISVFLSMIGAIVAVVFCIW